MKAMKKILALVLGTVMALALCVTAFAAANTQHTITINNSDSTKKHTYEAYQVFAGTLSDGKLTNITWGSGVNGAALLTALKADSTIGSRFASATTATAVADVLKDFTAAADIDAFALVVGKNLANVAGTSTQSASPYTISVTGDGYYFVKDKNDSVTEGGETYSKYMLKVVEDVKIEAKDDHLVPDKKIVDGNQRLDADSAAIGDEILFEVTVDIPDMDGYQNYVFKMVDTLCNGLDFDHIVSVKVGNTEIKEQGATGADANKYYTKTYANHVLTINFNNFIQYKGTAGKVTIQYVAILNENADLVAANENTVKFIYSNNPSQSGEPGWENATGTTPECKTKTFVTKLKLVKTGDGSKKLEGAQFKLEGTALNTVLVTGIKFEKEPYTAVAGETVEAGTYYKLKDGTYTTTAPTEATAGQYESTTDTYKKVSFEKTVTEAKNVGVTFTTNGNGEALFEGLNAGTYTLTEIVAPSGYNLLTAPIEFTITWTKDGGFAVQGEGIAYDSATNTFTITVDNKSGSVLPSTGSKGTTIIYALGTILVLGAGVVLVAKRRTGDEG